MPRITRSSLEWLVELINGAFEDLQGDGVVEDLYNVELRKIDGTYAVRAHDPVRGMMVVLHSEASKERIHEWLTGYKDALALIAGAP